MNPSADQAVITQADAVTNQTVNQQPTAMGQDNAAPITHAAPKTKGNFDTFVAKVRDRSPDWLVNSGTQVCLALKGSADGLSVWSALRKGSQSPWRLAGSLITLGAEILGTKIPEKKISEDKQQEYAQMSRWKYFITKTKEAFNPREHIAETSGFALVLNGLCLAMSGIVQSSKNHKSKETIQGLMTSAAGLIMTYMPDRERAWQVAHTTFMIRSVPAAFQAHDAYYKGNPEKNIAAGDWQQGAKWILNQFANIFGTLYGGVKKLPDGSIVHIGKKGEDITAPRQSRKLVDNGKHALHAAIVMPVQTPTTQIAEVTHADKIAEPEKAAELHVGAA